MHGPGRGHHLYRLYNLQFRKNLQLTEAGAARHRPCSVPPKGGKSGEDGSLLCRLYPRQLPRRDVGTNCAGSGLRHRTHDWHPSRPAAERLPRPIPGPWLAPKRHLSGGTGSPAPHPDWPSPIFPSSSFKTGGMYACSQTISRLCP